MAEQHCVTLPQLLDFPAPLNTAEAVAIARALAERAPELAGGPFPSLDRVAICCDRVDIVHGDAIDAGADNVQWIGEILNALLRRVPATELPVGLKTLVVRATGHKFGDADTPIETGAFPKLSNLTELMHALDKFAPADQRGALRAVFDRAAAPAPRVTGREVDGSSTPLNDHSDAAALTFADLHVRREAAGVSLAEIANATKVPLALFESLERGDVSRWPRGLYARAHLTAYARHVNVPTDDLVALVLAEMAARVPVEPGAIESPKWPAVSNPGAHHEGSFLAPALLIIAAVGTFAVAGPIIRHFKPSLAPEAAALPHPSEGEVAAGGDNAGAPPVAQSLAAQTPPRVSSFAAAATATTVPPTPAARVVNAPTRPPAPTEPVSDPVATTGANRAAAPPPRDPAPDPAAEAAKLAALRAERARLLLSLDDNEKALARVDEERRDVQALLDAAASDEDAAAFRKRLDELAQDGESLNRTKERLEEGLRVLDRRIKQ